MNQKLHWKLQKALSLAINRKELANSVGGAAEPADAFSENMTEVKGKDYTNLVRGTATKQFSYLQQETSSSLLEEGSRSWARRA